MKSKFATALTMFVLVAFGGTASAAATIYVATNGHDVPTCGASSAPCLTIGYALLKSADGDTVRVQNGTYFECVDVYPGATGIGGVTLETEAYNSTQAIGAATIDGTGQCDSASAFPGAVVTVEDGSTVRGFAVKHGGDSGIVGFGAVAITSNTISGNQTPTVGGGIYLYTGVFLAYPDTKAQIDHNSIDSNTADYDGGGIYVQATGDGLPSVVEISSNSVTNNTAGGVPGLPGYGVYGAGITVFTDTATASDISTVTITTNTVDGNTATGPADGSLIAYGGGIFVATGSSNGAGVEAVKVGLNGSGNLVRNNVSEGYGGGISVNLQPAQGSTHSIVVEGNSVTSNTGNSGGGGIHVYGACLDLTAGTSTLRVQDNTATGNHTHGSLSNFYDLGGGGLFAELYSYRTPAGIGDYRFERNKLTGNDSATLGAGASFLVVASDDPYSDGLTLPSDTSVVLANNLLAANTALDTATSAARGGGEYAFVEAKGGQATVSFDHDFLTVADNNTDTGAGGIEWDAYPVANSLGSSGSISLALTNSIIVDNQSFGVGGNVVEGPGVSLDLAYDDAYGNTAADWESQLVPSLGAGVISVDPTLDASYTPPFCSATIDKGDPAVAVTPEPGPNGGLVNLGHLGHTLAAIRTFPDINGDTFVDGLDVLGLSVSFNADSSSARYNPAADLDFDGLIDGQDLSYLTPFYAQACP